MKISEFKVEYGRTIRPADFESKTCRLEVHVVLDDGEDAKKLVDAILVKIKEKVEATLAEKNPPLIKGATLESDEDLPGGKFEV